MCIRDRYRNTFGIGHSLKEITEAHNTRHPLDPHKGSFGINHDGIYETVTNSLHFQLGLALAALGVATSLELNIWELFLLMLLLQGITRHSQLYIPIISI